MIIALSTSSPVASVALLCPESAGLTCAWSGARESNSMASGVCLALLEQGLLATGQTLGQIDGFVADVGPGSFTGTRVGVTLAKALAFQVGARAAGVSSFDLVSKESVVALASKRGEYLVRVPGCPPELWSTAMPALYDGMLQEVDPPMFSANVFGYGAALPVQTFPTARCVAQSAIGLQWAPAELLLPMYIVGPSISTPKRPYSGGAALG